MVSRRHIWGILGCIVACCGIFEGSCTLFAEAPMPPEQLSRIIDHHIAARWEAEDIVPAPQATDAEFLRRVYLDVTGKIPHAAHVREFLQDNSPDKRARLVDDLLRSPSYIIHYTNLWRSAMVPEAANDQQIRFALPGFESWLRSRIAENRNFAEIVEEMLTLPVDQESVIGFTQPEQPTPAAFYRAKQAQPESLAAATARLFLGVRIDCAQCHDHPFDEWKQEEFWQYAAFFTDIPPVPIPGQEMIERRTVPGTIRIPELDRVVEAAYLGSDETLSDAAGRDRATLAKWIVSPENPFFAKAAVNRIWSYHFGIGLVEPMDDFSVHNPPSHPELLDELAAAFIASDYNFKYMIRAMTGSQTYQLSSQQTHPSQSRQSLFARMPVRGMTAEQIFDSLAVATGYRQPFDPEQPLNFNNDQARQEFITMFGNITESAPDRASTVLQALTMMNGDFVGDATDLADSRTLAAIVDAPFLDRSQKLDALYLTTLNRFPTEQEQERMLGYLETHRGSAEQPAALSDIFWVLLNSSEFLLNH